MRRIALLALLASTASVSPAFAAPDDVYTLGELQVTARTRSGEMIGGSVVRW